MSTPNQTPPGANDAALSYTIYMSNGQSLEASLTTIQYVDLLRCMGKPTVYSTTKYDLNGMLISSIRKAW